MNIYTNTPYTYRISWSKTGMNYYGVRYAKGCDPSDLFVTYFTSSKYVSEYIKEHGLPDIIEVRRTFTGVDRMVKSLEHEHRVLTRLKVTIRTDYLNQQNNGAKFYLDKTNFEVETKRLENLRIAQSKEECKSKKRVSMKKFLADKNNLEKFMAVMNTEEKIEKRRDFFQNDPRIKAWREVTGDQTSRYDHTVYHFVHVSGEEVFATRYDMRIRIDSSAKSSKLDAMATGKRNTYKGWSLFGKSSDRAIKRAKNKYA